MQFLSLPLLLFIGLLIGISGIGGFLIPPILLAAFAITVRQSIVIALGAQIIIYLGGFLPYFLNKSVIFKLSFVLIVGSIPGSLLGLTANLNLSETMLKISLAIFLLAIILLLIGKKSSHFNCTIKNNWLAKKIQINKKILKQLYILITGFLGGVMSGLIGVGGPVISVPLLMFISYNPKLAIGTSLFSGVFIVSFAFLFHLFHTQITLLTPFLVGTFTTAGSIVGARFAGKFKEETTRIIVICASIFSIIYLLILS